MEDKSAEETIKEIASIAWKGAANAFRLYPDNKHTFEGYWDAAKNQFSEYHSLRLKELEENNNGKKRTDEQIDSYWKLQFAQLQKQYDTQSFRLSKYNSLEKWVNDQLKMLKLHNAPDRYGQIENQFNAGWIDALEKVKEILLRLPT